MPPRDPALPEGTDHIIQGAAQLDGGAGGGGGNGGASGGGGSTAGGSGFVASGGGGDTGGTTTGGGTAVASTGGGGSTGSSGGGSGGSGSGGLGASAEKIRTQVRDQIQSLKGQATDKARQFADDGKGRATTMLDDLGAVIGDAARAIDERLGSEYSGYAHRAAGAVTGFAGTLRDRDVEDLLDDTRAAIRRSPGIAIGVAALVGFGLVRVLKTGLDDTGFGGGQSSGQPGGGGAGGTGSGAGAGV